MGTISNEKLKEISNYFQKNGKEKTLSAFGLSDETFNRYLRFIKERGIDIFESNALLVKIRDIYTDSELQAIAKGGRLLPGAEKVPIINFDGKHIKIGCITDTHIGSLFFDERRLQQAFDEFKKEKVDFIVHAGDVTEGMSNRAGHVYELSAIGYEQQKELAVSLFSEWTDTDIYAIDGNHDRWFIKSNGAHIVKDIDREIKNFHFIGHDEGDISLKGKTTIKLWHGEDGSSYALSYRLQKILESLSGGEKPSIMITGHVHKYVKIFERNVHCVSVGTLQRQTKWMRGKRISAHVGFVIVDVWINYEGVAKFRDTWYPFYT